jgi:hypothetical protein
MACGLSLSLAIQCFKAHSHLVLVGREVCDLAVVVVKLQLASALRVDPVPEAPVHPVVLAHLVAEVEQALLPVLAVPLNR